MQIFTKYLNTFGGFHSERVRFYTILVLLIRIDVFFEFGWADIKMTLEADAEIFRIGEACPHRYLCDREI